MNHRTKITLLKVDLNIISESFNIRPNVVYSLIPYYKFEKDKNPLLIINDRINGVYILNLLTLQKS